MELNESLLDFSHGINLNKVQQSDRKTDAENIGFQDMTIRLEKSQDMMNESNEQRKAGFGSKQSTRAANPIGPDSFDKSQPKFLKDG